MTEKPEEVAPELTAEEQAKLKALLEKDAKSGRDPVGVWKAIVALLGGAMVVFYFYAAGITSVATQYHRGVYVFLTYVLVFLLYPAGKTPVRAGLVLILGAFAAGLVGVWYFGDAAAFHARLVEVGAAWSDGGAGAAAGRLLGLWPLLLVTLAAAAVIFVADRRAMVRWPRNPAPSDVLFALASAGAVYYWIHEFENLNYRAGAETESGRLDQHRGDPAVLGSLPARARLGDDVDRRGLPRLRLPRPLHARGHRPSRLRPRAPVHVAVHHHQRRLRRDGERARHLRDPLHLLRRVPPEVGRRQVLHRPPHGARGQDARAARPRSPSSPPPCSARCRAARSPTPCRPGPSRFP